MKKLILIIMIFSGFSLFAQEKLFPVLPENDTLFIETGKPLMYNPFMMDLFSEGEMNFQLQNYRFGLPAEMQQRWTFDLRDKVSLFTPENMFLFANPGMLPSLFLRDGAVLSGASYQVNNRFSLGGYSFAGNSVFTAPLPGRGFNQFDVHGSTLFMQYNVSKKFKIETRFNVTRGPGY